VYFTFSTLYIVRPVDEDWWWHTELLLFPVLAPPEAKIYCSILILLLATNFCFARLTEVGMNERFSRMFTSDSAAAYLKISCKRKRERGRERETDGFKYGPIQT
jgi:hypothetical protein